MNSIFNDKKYWSRHYDNVIKSHVSMGPSPFAQYLLASNVVKKRTVLIELGCGTGRDAVYFAGKQVVVTAIDQCSNTSSLLNKHKNIFSYPADFTNMDMLANPVDIVYSRFTLHSINERDESRTLQWAFSNLKSGGALCVEVRTTKDPLCGKGVDKGSHVWFYNDHHRRFVDAEVFKLKLIKVGFDIEYFCESNGFAIFKNEDPIVLRSIVRRP